MRMKRFNYSERFSAQKLKMNAQDINKRISVICSSIFLSKTDESNSSELSDTENEDEVEVFIKYNIGVIRNHAIDIIRNFFNYNIFST